MKHLCIINPMAGQVSGRINEIVEEIEDFFSRNSGMSHTTHITRWKRDASGYTMRFVKNALEMVRIYVFGGGGTFFEVINGTINLPNVQVAYYPLGKDDDLLTVFGKQSSIYFKSMQNLSLSPVKTIDTILAGNHYVAASILIGIGVNFYRTEKQMSERFMLPKNISQNIATFFCAFIKGDIQHYRIETDNIELEDDYIGILVANIPGNGKSFSAPEARFDDSYMDLYVIKPPPRSLILKIIMDYQRGLYIKWPEYISHFRCKKIQIFSPGDMTMSLDGEFFLGTELSLEIRPASLDFVCPSDMNEEHT